MILLLEKNMTIWVCLKICTPELHIFLGGNWWSIAGWDSPFSENPVCIFIARICQICRRVNCWYFSWYNCQFTTFCRSMHLYFLIDLRHRAYGNVRIRVWWLSYWYFLSIQQADHPFDPVNMEFQLGSKNSPFDGFWWVFAHGRYGSCFNWWVFS